MKLVSQAKYSSVQRKETFIQAQDFLCLIKLSDSANLVILVTTTTDYLYS